ncbi:hypothetical protein HZA43_06070, partial [Candidatus Peregrinibacteria bacterium]|nr:hypothetical protein [Candidatus Peregrinibacteria bacterium]
MPLLRAPESAGRSSLPARTALTALLGVLAACGPEDSPPRADAGKPGITDGGTPADGGSVDAGNPDPTYRCGDPGGEYFAV